MEKIKELLEKLDNKVTVSLNKRLDGLEKLEERLVLAKSEHEANPTEESEQSLSEIQNYISDITEDLIEDLEELLEKRQATPPAPTPSPEPIPAEVVEEKEEKSGMSVFGVVLGVVLLVGTAGAYNYFNKNR
jgi:acetylornithine deacetylase/succinyl-diaminopimelate desuccinylase-like protein